MIFTSSLVFALCLIQPFLSAALSFVDYDACTKAQTDATDHYIMCIYEQKSVAECQSTFMYDWKELSSGVCPKTQPASQSILNLVGICLGEKFTQEKCIKLSGYFIECAHEEDEPIKGCPYDLKICPDGSSVIRDPDNNCEFSDCELQSCYTDVRNALMVPTSAVILTTIVTSNLAAVLLKNTLATARTRQLDVLTENGLVPQIDGTGAKKNGLGRVHLASNVRCRVAHMN